MKMARKSSASPATTRGLRDLWQPEAATTSQYLHVTYAPALNRSNQFLGLGTASWCPLLSFLDFTDDTLDLEAIKMVSIGRQRHKHPG